MAKKKKKDDKERMTPHDRQGTKPAGASGLTKPKKSMARKTVRRASERRSKR